MEPILEFNDSRFVFDVKYLDLDNLYKQHRASFWSPEEVDLSQDTADWKKLSTDEQYFIEHILAFFAISDGLVNENLVQNFYNEVQYPEARAFYSIQIMMEQIHSETYGLLLKELVPDRLKQNKLFNAVEHFPAIRDKVEWMKKWTHPENASFVERLIAFAAVEGIFFSGSFCSIFWLKKRGILPGLTFSNELISRDEGLHCKFAINLYRNHIVNKISHEKIREILLGALTIEKEFIIESLPVKLIGMNSKLMTQYLEFVTDYLLKQLGCSPEFHVSNPFEFMNLINLEGKTNFFEKRVSEYQKVGVLRFDMVDDE
jgi:ribonucleoside-diphosphate reductase beta chain